MIEVKGYSLEDACRSYRWMGHASGFTELVALHPAYKQGAEHLEWNKEHKTFPITRYVQNEQQVLGFLQKYQDSGRMLCMSINPRPQAFKNSKGYERGAREEEVERAQNILFDFDLEKGVASLEALAALDSFGKEADSYFADLGLKAPVRAYTGRGFHLLFAHSPIATKECPDLAGRVSKFAADFRDDLHKELAALNVGLDKTHDLRRMVRIYGTAKPGVGISSRFHGKDRVEDEGLHKYLLGMKLGESAASDEPLYGPSLMRIYDRLPAVVETLLRRDEKLREFWNGNGKPQEADTSGSGYDFSVARRLIILGVRDVDILGTAIALRPDSSYAKRSKDEQYLRRTVAAALTK